MTKFQLLRQQFIQLMEQVSERRGFKPIHGRILACLFLSPESRTQHAIARWTGYSISAVSRTLDQLVAIGSVRRFKEPGDRSFKYEVGTSLVSLFIGAIESWFQIVDRAHTPIRTLAEAAKSIDTSRLSEAKTAEARQLTQQLGQLDGALTKVKPIFQETLKQLQNLS